MISINVFNWTILLCLPRPSGNLISFMIILRTQGYLAAGKVMRNGIFHITSNTYGKSSQSYEHLYIEFSCVRCCIYHSIQPLRAAHCQRSSRKPPLVYHTFRTNHEQGFWCVCVYKHKRATALLLRSLHDRARTKYVDFADHPRRADHRNADDTAVAHSVHILWMCDFSRECVIEYVSREPHRHLRSTSIARSFDRSEQRAHVIASIDRSIQFRTSLESCLGGEAHWAASAHQIDCWFGG